MPEEYAATQIFRNMILKLFDNEFENINPIIFIDIS